MTKKSTQSKPKKTKQTNQADEKNKQPKPAQQPTSKQADDHAKKHNHQHSHNHAPQPGQDKQTEMIADNSSITITIPWEKVEPVYQKILQTKAKKLKIKGFRQGKVPQKIAEEKIGQPSLFETTLQQLLPTYYQQAIKKADKKPLTYPEFKPLSINLDNDWQIKAVFAQKPEIKIKGYKKIVKQAKKQAQKQIKQAEKERKQAQAKQEKTDKKAESKKSGKGKSKKADQKATATDRSQPQLTDKQKDDMTIQVILSQLIQQLEPKIPGLLVKHNTQREIENLQNRLKQLNLEMDQYLQSQNLTPQQLTNRLAYSSLNQLQAEFLLQAIAEEEKIVVEKKEVEDRINQVEDENAKKKMQQDQRYQSYLEAVLQKQKVIDYLLKL